MKKSLKLEDLKPLEIQDQLTTINGGRAKKAVCIIDISEDGTMFDWSDSDEA